MHTSRQILDSQTLSSRRFPKDLHDRPGYSCICFGVKCVQTGLHFPYENVEVLGTSYWNTIILCICSCIQTWSCCRVIPTAILLHTLYRHTSSTIETICIPFVSAITDTPVLGIRRIFSISDAILTLEVLSQYARCCVVPRGRYRG